MGPQSRAREVERPKSPTGKSKARLTLVVEYDEPPTQDEAAELIEKARERGDPKSAVLTFVPPLETLDLLR